MLRLEDLGELLDKHGHAARAKVAEFSIGPKFFAFNSGPAIIGVINLSADSWYRESVCLDAESAIRRGQVLAAQGAAIVDLGAESTLAPASRSDEALQKDKRLPVIRELHRAGLLASVDTYNAEGAKASLEDGAPVMNLTGVAGSHES